MAFLNPDFLQGFHNGLYKTLVVSSTFLSNNTVFFYFIYLSILISPSYLPYNSQSSPFLILFDTAQNNRINGFEIAKILALGTDQEQTEQLTQGFGDSVYLFNSTAATFKNGTARRAIFLQAETWPTLRSRNANIGTVITVK